MAFHTIVVGFDETEPATRALAQAADLVDAFKGSLIVTSVAPVPTAGGRGPGPIDPTEPPQEHGAQLAEARRYLESRNVKAEYVLAVGDPAGTILELAEEREADLIVVGTREPGIVSRLLGQSVSGAVTRRAHCAVLISH